MELIPFRDFFVQDFRIIYLQKHWDSLSEDRISGYNSWSGKPKPQSVLSEAKAFGGHKMSQNVQVLHTS